MARTRTRPPHPFTEATHRDPLGRPVCGTGDCGLPQSAAVHDMPPNPAAEHEARRYGERSET